MRGAQECALEHRNRTSAYQCWRHGPELREAAMEEGATGIIRGVGIAANRPANAYKINS